MNRRSLRYFAAANSGGGFFSLFRDVFSPEKFDRMYIIKGGPGCGKSTMMKKIGAEAELRGLPVEYVLCASDPDSLDGVIIRPLGVAVTDGTAPHVMEPEYPAAVEQIVDLYSCLDRGKLVGKRDAIISLSKTAARETGTARRCLSALKDVVSGMRDALAFCWDAPKAERAARRIVEKMHRGGEGGTLFIGAECGKGNFRSESFFDRARIRYAVTGKFRSGEIFVTELCRAAKKAGVAVTEFRSPVDPSLDEAAYFGSDGIYFAVCGESDAEKYDRKINLMRFIDRKRLAEIRGRLRFSEKCAEALLSGATEGFLSAAKAHSELETIYGDAMDFSLADEKYEDLREKIFGKTEIIKN